MPANGDTARYDAFISYSHAADAKLAPAVQTGLQRFAKPWYRLRALRIFRDKTSLSATPELWGTIEKALAASKYFLLLASPEAAQSRWVRQEVRFWLANKSPRSLLIGVTGGAVAWSDDSGDFDSEASTAVPPDLLGVYEQEPLYIDLSRTEDPERLSLQDGEFRQAITYLAATIHERPLDEMAGEHVRQHKRTVKTVWSAVFSLLALTVAAVVGAYFAVVNAREARAKERLAVGRQLAAEAELAYNQRSDLVERSVLLALESLARAPSPTTGEALRRYVSLLADPMAQLQHQGTVHSLSFSPYGDLLATSAGDRAARIWNLEIFPLETARFEHDQLVDDARLTPDSKHLVTASWDGVVRVWDVATQQVVGQVAHGATPRMATSGEYLATVDSEPVPPAPNVVRVWRLPSCGGVTQMTHDGPVADLRFSRDGRRLATASWDGTARLWNVDTGAELSRFRHDGPVRAVALSAEDRLVATASDDYTACVWQLPGGAAARCVRHDREVTHVRFHPTGRFLITGSADRTVRVWEISSGRETARLRHDAEIYGLELSEDGSLVASWSAESQAVRIWDTFSARELRRASHESSVNAAAFSPNGRILATASGHVLMATGEPVDPTVRLWKLEKIRRGSPLVHPKSEAMRFDPDGHHLVTSGWDGTARVWDVTRGLEAARVTHGGRIMSLAISPDGKRIATGSEDRELRLWKIGSAETIWSTVQPSWIRDLDFSSDGRYLASGSEDGVVRVHSGEDGSERWSFRFETSSGLAEIIRVVGRLRFSSDGSYLAASVSGSTKVWRLPDTAELLSVEHPNQVSGFVWSPDGRQIVIYVGSTARRWILPAPEAVATMPHGDSIQELAWSPDGRFIATASNYRIKLWSALEERQPLQLNFDVDIYSLAFLPTGEALAVGFKDHTVRVLELPVGREIERIGLDAPAYQIELSPDAKLLATHLGDGRTVVSTLRHADLIAMACQRLGRNLTLGEWRSSLSTEPYALTCRQKGIHPSFFEFAEEIAVDGDLQAVEEHLRAAQALDPNLDFDARQFASGLVESAWTRGIENALQEGSIGEALSKYERLGRDEMSAELSLEALVVLCWQGALNGLAQRALPACEAAVSAAPEESRPVCRTGRGLARALTGDLAGAREDFASFVAHFGDDEAMAPLVHQHRAWIADLDAGRNPIDEAALDALRQ